MPTQPQLAELLTAAVYPQPAASSSKYMQQQSKNQKKSRGRQISPAKWVALPGNLHALGGIQRRSLAPGVCRESRAGAWSHSTPTRYTQKRKRTKRGAQCCWASHLGSLPFKCVCACACHVIHHQVPQAYCSSNSTPPIQSPHNTITHTHTNMHRQVVFQTHRHMPTTCRHILPAVLLQRSLHACTSSDCLLWCARAP